MEPPVEDRATRRRAAALAGHTADEPAARALAVDPNSEVRATAFAALARMGALRPADVDAAVGDADPAVRRRAAELAAEPELRAGAVAWLARLLDDSDATVVEVAAWASGELDPPATVLVDALAALATTHADTLVREAAVAALGAIGDEGGLPAILTGTRDKPAIRRRAVLALAPFDGPEVDAALERARSDRDPQVRQAAEWLG